MLRPRFALLPSLALASFVVAQSAPLALKPLNASSVYTCGELDIEWTGGDAPYHLTLHDELGYTPLAAQPLNALRYLWTVKDAAKKVVALVLTDSQGALVVSQPLEVQWSPDRSCLDSDPLDPVLGNDALLNDAPPPQPGGSSSQSLRTLPTSPFLADPLPPLGSSLPSVHLPNFTPFKLFQILLGAVLSVITLTRLCLNRRRRARRSPFLGGVSDEDAEEGWMTKAWSTLRRNSESDLSLDSISEGGSPRLPVQ